MLPDSDLYPAAGASAVVALIALVISGITLALFFGGAGAFWGPVNDMFIVVTVLALILAGLPLVAIGTWLGQWLSSRLDERRFSLVVNILLLASGAALLLK